MVNGLTNIKGWYISNDTFSLLKENKNKDTYIQGLLLPKDVVSRNKVLYDWGSIKDHYKELIGKPMLFNHDLETTDRPVGKFVDSWLQEDDEGENIAGWYYKSKLNPRSQYYNDVVEGFINKVSIQLNASEVSPEFKDGKEYERAYISDILEASGVNVAGYDQTSIETLIAEAYKNNKFIEDYNDEFNMGFKIEKGEHPELKDTAIKQLVIDHLKKDNAYYSNENKKEDINTANVSGAIAPTIMKKDSSNDSNMEDEIMDKKIKKETYQDPDKVTKPKQDEEVIKENEDTEKKDNVLKEEYNDDMTKIVEALELIKDDNKSLKEELDMIKTKLPKDEDSKEPVPKEQVPKDKTIKKEALDDDKDLDKDKKEAVEEDKDKDKDKEKKLTESEDADDKVVPEEKTVEDKVIRESEDSKDDSTKDTKKEADEDKDKEDKDKDKVNAPIPPKTESSKLNQSLKETITTKPEMTYKEAFAGFVNDRLKI